MHPLNNYIEICCLVSTFLILGSGSQFLAPIANGIEKLKPSARIAGGHDANKGQYPWIVSVQVTNFEIGYHICGGVLITEEWVLTAAHCLDSEMPEWMWIVTGEYDMSVEEGTEQRLLVDTFIPNPDYDYSTRPYLNDLALMHLSTPAVLNDYTQPAPIPTTPVTAEEVCEEAGWGSISDSGGGSDILQVADVTLLDNSICDQDYGPLTEGQLCGGNVDGGVGFCSGDNGGPLHCVESTTGSYVVRALMSWRNGCASPNLPGVYENLYYYENWIYDVINGFP